MDRIKFDPSKCMSCNSCFQACAMYNSHSDDIFEAIHKKPIPFPRCRISNNEFIACNHCEDAPCINSCSSNAIFRDSFGYVQINTSECFGCGLCVAACPTNSIIIKNKLAFKCTGCPTLEIPSCVQACHSKALSI